MKKGFTLIELLVVITIIAILAAVSLVNYSQVTKNGRDSKRQSDIKQVQSALEQYFADQFFYPAGNLLYGSELSNLTGRSDGVNPTKKSYLNKTPCDPSTGNCTLNTGNHYCYVSTPVNCSNGTTLASKCTNYELYAALENPPTPVTYYSVCNTTNTYNLRVIRP